MQETSELTSDCSLHHTRVMVRISGHVAVNVQLLAKCGELDTKLSVTLVQHNFFWAKSRNGSGLPVSTEGTLIGCVPTIQQTLQLVDCDFSSNPAHRKPSSMYWKRHLRAPPRTLPHVGVQHIQMQIGQFACTLKTNGQSPCDLEKGTSELRQLCKQDKVQQPHKKLDQVWFQ